MFFKTSVIRVIGAPNNHPTKSLSYVSVLVALVNVVLIVSCGVISFSFSIVLEVSTHRLARLLRLVSTVPSTPQGNFLASWASLNINYKYLGYYILNPRFKLSQTAEQKQNY